MSSTLWLLTSGDAVIPTLRTALPGHPWQPALQTHLSGEISLARTAARARAVRGWSALGSAVEWGPARTMLTECAGTF